jgi:hypothetical protein
MDVGDADNIEQEGHSENRTATSDHAERKPHRTAGH